MKNLLFFICIILSINTIYTFAMDFDESYFNKNYSQIAEKIINYSQQNEQAYLRLQYMCDVFGPRLSGSENLEKTIEWLIDEMKKDGFENVRGEEVFVPHWVRRSEKCNMIYPRKADIPIVTLGGSIATPKNGIKAQVISVKSFEELEKRKDEVKGKIVLYNYDYQGYGKSVKYRFYGAVIAAKYGAVASLIRSISPKISQNLHTGMMIYEDTIPKIPHAAISPEDAMLIERLISYGKTPELELFIDVETLPDALSHNVIGEIKGSEFPNEIIAIGGHTDSWDLGTGAHDNASGCIVTWEAINLLKKIGLKPKRTIRVVQWTNEENGVRGGNAYKDAHQNEKHVLMFEHDSGIFPPTGIRFSGNDTILSILKNTSKLYDKIADFNISKGGGGVDIAPMVKTGVPAMSLETNDDGKYFYYHHSSTDTVDKIKKEELNDCIAAIAIAIYIYSDLPSDLFN